VTDLLSVRLHDLSFQLTICKAIGLRPMVRTLKSCHSRQPYIHARSTPLKSRSPFLSVIIVISTIVPAADTLDDFTLPTT